MNLRKFFFTFCFLFAFIISCFSQSKVEKVRIMYRGDATSNTITIGWNQLEGPGGTVFYDTINYTRWLQNDSIPLVYRWHQPYNRMVDYMGMKNCFARLTGLIPGKMYYFVILDNFGWDKKYCFKTPSANSNDTLSVICGGGSRTDLIYIGESDNRLRRQYAETMISVLKPDLVVFSGDFILNFVIQYSLISDKETEWKDWLDDWSNQTQTRIRTTGIPSYRLYPIVVAQGNHETAIDLYNLFDTPNQEVYYAHGFCGDLFRLYTLNTKTSITGNQLTFLTNDLSSHQNVKWKMANYCNPIRPHVSGFSEGDMTYDYWPPLFRQYGVNLVSEVGTNTCKQTWPIIPCSSGDDCDEDFIRNDTLGTVYIGEGGFGSPLASPDKTKKWTRAAAEIDHFNLLWISKYKIEVRTVLYGNSSALTPVADSNRFRLPSKISLWDNTYGKVLIIGDRQHLPSVKISGPADNTQVSSINNVLITAEASDPDGTIDRVAFYSNDTLIGTASASPYQVNHIFPSNRKYVITAMVYDNEGNNNLSFPVRLYSGFSGDTLIKVIASADDAEENMANSDVNIASAYLDFTIDTLVGVRFSHPNIPQGKEILSSYIQFIAGSTSDTNATISIIGEYGNNARVYQNLPLNISGRRLTNEAITWSPASWNEGDTVKTPDITTIISEIINQPGWSEYSSMGFVFKTTEGQRSVYSYDGDAAKSAVLYYEYRTVNPFLGIDENTPGKEAGIISEIFPNPARGNVNIRLNSDGKVQLSVYDHLGRICKNIALKSPSGLYKLNINDLTPGVYYINVRSGDKLQTEKLLIN